MNWFRIIIFIACIIWWFLMAGQSLYREPSTAWGSDVQSMTFPLVLALIEVMGECIDLKRRVRSLEKRLEKVEAVENPE